MGGGGGGMYTWTIAEVACCERCRICWGTHETFKQVMSTVEDRTEFVKVHVQIHIHVEFYVARE